MLLLLDLRDLVSVLVGPGAMAVVCPAVKAEQQPAGLPQQPQARIRPPRVAHHRRPRARPRARVASSSDAGGGDASAFGEKLGTAAGASLVSVLSGGTVHQAVGVGRRLAIAEIGAVSAASYSSGHPRLLYGLADEHTVLLELFGENGIQERVAAGVERQDEDREDLGLFQSDELQSEGRGEGEESDGGPADEVGEDEQSHPLGDARVVGVPGLRAADGAVHLEVTAHEDEEGHAVDEHEQDDVGEAGRSRGGLEGQAHGELAVVGDAEEWQDRHDQGEAPSAEHDVARVLEGQALVEVHRVGDGVVALQGDDGQRVHGQLCAEDAQETRQLATCRHLPGDGVLAELSQSRGVDHGQETCNGVVDLLAVFTSISVPPLSTLYFADKMTSSLRNVLI